MSLKDQSRDGAPLSASGGGNRDIRDQLAGAEGLTAADVVELACADQLRQWRHGEFIPSEAYFGLHPALQADGDGAFELAYAEFALRDDLGESPSLAEFLWRFPRHAERFRIQVAMDRAIKESTVLDPDVEGGGPTARGRAGPVLGHSAVNPWPTAEGFEIEAEIGRGGMGVVYKARQVALNRTVALKMILGGDRSPVTMARFRAEGEAVARLHHPNIVQIHGLGDQDGHPYFVLEYLDGGNLASRLDSRGWPSGEAARLIELLARGVEEAHRHGVVHRDLKPSNILLAADGTPKLADFGLAKILDFDGGLTRTEAILGTPSYMSPEQAEGRHADVGGGADIYALGAIFYELLTGRPPFRAPTLLQTLELVRSEEPVAPSRLQPGLPRDAETVCLKCLEKSPSRRYASAGALADDLKRFLARESILARPSQPWERAGRWCARNPAVAALSAAFAIALIVGFAGIVWKWREAEARRSQVVRAEQATAFQLRRSVALQRDTEAAHAEAVRTRNDSQRLSANLALNRALELSRHDEIGPALLWMVESLRFAPDDDPSLKAVIRRNLTAWSGRLHGLRQVFLHPQSVTHVALSPDGTAALTGCRDGNARLWDLKTGTLLTPPWPCGGPVECVAFSPDGRAAVTGGETSARLRNAKSGVPFGAPMVHPSRVFRAVFRRDGKRLVTTFRGDSALIWDAETGEPIGPPITSNHPEWIVFCADFSPDGKIIVTGMMNRNGLDHEAAVQRWEADTGRPIGPPLPMKAAVLVVQYSPEGLRLLTAGVDGKCQVRDATTLESVAPPLSHPTLVEPAVFSPDGTTILTGCADGLARWWDIASGRLLGEALVHEASVWGLAFDSTGRFALTGCADRSARLWELAADLTGTRPRPEPRPETATATAASDPRRVTRVLFSPDRRLVLTVDAGGRARLADTATGLPVGAPMRVPAGRAAVLAFSPDSARLAISTDATGAPLAQVWDARGRLLSTLPVGLRAVFLAFGPDGNQLATIDLKGVIALWDAATGRPSAVALSQQKMAFNEIDFAPDGKFLFAATQWGPTVFRWDAATGALCRDAFPFAPGTAHLAVSPDGGKLVTVASKMVRLWDAATGNPLGPPIVPSSSPQDAGFTDDGKTVLTLGRDGGIRLSDAQTGRQLGPPMAHSGPVVAVDIGPDNRFLLAVGAEGTVQLWDVATSRPIGPPSLSRSKVLGAILRPDGRSFVSAAEDGTTTLRTIPEPTPGDLATLALRFQVLTGRQLDQDQTLTGLTPDVWREHEGRLPGHGKRGP